MINHKDTNKRARNIKFTLIFFIARESIFMVYHKDTNKQAKYRKAILMSKSFLDVYLKDCNKRRGQLKYNFIATQCEV